MNEFKKGDLVTLKSGGSFMRVLKIKKVKNEAIKEKLKCSWYTPSGKEFKEWFIAPALMKLETFVGEDHSWYLKFKEHIIKMA